jgi:hypothetical protein
VEQLNDYLIRHGQKPIDAPTDNISKYHNQQITVDGEKRDSLQESNRLEELKILQRLGEIKDLQTQVPFTLIPSQKGENRNERPVKYIADFVYQERQPNGTWKQIVEDTKGYKTKDYTIKRKLMLFIHGISIKET